MRKIQCKADKEKKLFPLIIDTPDGGDCLWIGRKLIQGPNSWEFLGSISSKKQLQNLIKLAQSALRAKRK